MGKTLPLVFTGKEVLEEVGVKEEMGTLRKLHCGGTVREGAPWGWAGACLVLSGFQRERRR